MRIRRLLKFAALLSILSVSFVAAALMSLQLMDARHSSATEAVNAAIRKISLIRGFLPELSNTPHQRAALQWQTQFAELVPILEMLPALDGATRSLKARVVQEHAAVGALFDKLSLGEQGEAPSENREMIGGQLDVRTASMVADVLAMNDLTVAAINREKQRVMAGMAISVVVLAGVIGMLLWTLQRRVVTPIVGLEEATGNLSAGRLDQPIAVTGSDEIAALAASFEYMRISLRDRLADLDAARAQIREENEKLAERVEERTAELKAANEELDSFAYAVAHDLRGPLRAMGGFSQALLEDYGERLTGEARVYLDQINAASLRMGELIEGLLVLSRSTRTELRRDSIDLTGLSRRILAELATLEPDRQVESEVQPGLATRGDTRMIEAVMRNLIANAWKYTSRTVQPTIRVFAEDKDESRFYCVKDNGAGFDMAHAGKLFQPFQRLHRQEEFSGTGVGLATVERIVHRHGGAVRAAGAPGKGATFCFSLPVADGSKGTP